MTCTKCGKPLLSGGKFCAHCGAPAPEVSSDPLINQTLGAYRVLKPLAAGAMGQVYLGEQTNLGRTVCIKTLKPELLGDANATARFEREARAVSGLKHPNIAQVIDFGRSGSHLYLVMELIEGGSLRGFLDAFAPVDLERASHLMSQILSALQEAHHAGIVHRDLKPENVLIAQLRDGSELAKVVDFGIAKLVSEQASGSGQNLTGTGLVCGTPGYMAPEQISGELLDPRCDVYAAGVIFFELLTGKKPFHGDTLTDLIRAHLLNEPPAPSSVAKLPLPKEVDELVLAALARERDQRIESALEFKRRIEQLRPSTRVTTGKLPAQQLFTCPSCQAQNPPTQKFCGQCGGALSGADSGEHALRQVLPGALATHAAQLGQSLGAERRQATVIFGDISGFTAMSERQSPEKVREIVNRCFDGMVEAVARYDGSVDKFIGDAIMVVFGAPNAHEDDPERAVRCALDMQAYLTEVNKTLAAPLKMRIGINAGAVVAGGVGGQRRMDYTVMGDTVNLAQRLEAAASPGKILVSATVKRLTDRAIRYRTLPPITVKGKAEPIAIFEVEGPWESQRKEGEQLVGRRTELGRVEQLLKQLKAGKPGGMIFLGDLGMGKTQLLDEAARLCSASGVRTAVARARKMIAPGELELVRDTLFAVCGRQPNDDHEADALLDELAALGVNPQDIARLKHVFGSNPSPRGYDREETRRLALSAATNALLGVAKGKHGLCVLLDDVHLADSSSLAYFDEIIRLAQGTPFGLIATGRGGHADRVLKRVPRVELSAMPLSDLMQMVKQQLGGADAPEGLARIIEERAEGNPFIATELLRTLMDNGALQLRGGTWGLSETRDGFQLPESLAQLVSARFDALGPNTRAFLRCAALHGRIFPVDLVAQAVEDAQVDVAAAVAEARHRGLVVDVVQPPGCLQFRQEFVHQLVAKSVSDVDKKHLHGRLADALELGLPSGDSHPAEAMARHSLAAGRTRKAATYFSLSAERLASRSALPAAIEAYQKAITLTQQEAQKLSGSPADAWKQVLQLASKAAPLQGIIATSDAWSLLDDVLKKAPAGIDTKSRAVALHQRGLLELRLGRAPDAAQSMAEAQRLFGPDVSPEIAAAIQIDVASAKEAMGEHAGATSLLLDALKLIAGKKLVDKDLMWKSLNQLGRIHLRVGEVQKAIEFFTTARAQAQRALAVVGEVRSLTNLAAAMGAKGQTDDAQRLFGEALELARKECDAIDIARINFNLGRLAAAAGRTDEARQRLEETVKVANEVGWREGIASATQALEALGARGAQPSTGTVVMRK
ncbi:MAG: protein kinase [Archangiaceae bacterium]|nr:protein kinase [Archangiaceae bacterium]